MFDLLIENGTIVAPDAVFQGDLGVSGERIAAVMAPRSKSGAARVLDATGLYVVPGGVDAHTHIQFPYGDTMTNDDFTSGTIAAAFGGTTTIIDFAVQARGTSALKAIEARLDEMKGSAVVDYALHSCLTEASASVLEEIGEIIGMGVGSFKLYLTYRADGKMVDDGALLAILREVKRHGGLVGVHAENAAISEYLADDFLRRGLLEAKYHALSTPNIVEAEAIHRAMYLATSIGAPLYIYHLSTREGAGLIRSARVAGVPVYAETCPHYLVLTGEVYERPDARNFLVSPPLRSTADRDELWRALRDRTVSVVASDGLAADSRMKSKGSNFAETPKGLAGVETRLPVVWSEGVAKGRITPQEFVGLVSTNPAKIFGLYPQKGCIVPGSDADLVLIDPARRVKLDPSVLHMQVDYTIFEGLECLGYPVATICRGRPVIENGRFVGDKGRGRFVPAKIPPGVLDSVIC